MQIVKGFKPPALILRSTVDSPHMLFRVQGAMTSPLLISIHSLQCTDGCGTIGEQKFIQKKIRRRKNRVATLISSHLSINCSQDGGSTTCVLVLWART